MFPVAKIFSVSPQENHTLLIELSNHHRIIYDMRPRLQTVRFNGLNDLVKFRTVRVEDENTLVWDDICQITIDEIIDMVER